MKFVNYLEKISGVGIYPLLSLLLFTIVFVLVVLYAMRASNETIAEMENLPLDEKKGL
ncbi:cytochrome C oxidase Cbb3 [Niabella ginsenosidivorans]|uniref:Cytochrome C oxidase Cbb3 n=1 Tax=Niabella ginsenosidivorans TaxID=1176587 RepID=A0A1A9I2N6_9BACT|nr:CcoQ/FixQ family Cbb3-type cytochrome c oxidase assembly chaperone [Niabella ginsenosidivorans]ANH81329.1 cytochrome C oxidase Cbb3 [Niabella ginsenosidivorans]